tara:strand:- start:234 stop:1412 length:1179 start_codon:yes stop_codon:yes gene_type:complete
MSEEVKQEGEFKMKKKPGRPKKLNKSKEESTVKVDLNKKEEDAIPESEPTRVVLPPDGKSKEEGTETEVELQPMGEAHAEKQETTEESKEEIVVEEIVEQVKKPTEEVTTPPVQQTQSELPENIESLVKFMKDTGGTLEDYVNLNKDYTKVDDNAVLREYYNKSKPHLDSDEIDFLLEDKFSWNEDEETEREIKKKKLAYKEEIAKAKNFLEASKGDYYKDIKLKSNSNVTKEQQEALDFLNTYRQSQEQAQKLHGAFKQKTQEFFKGDFNGFNFDVGEKSFRYKLNNPGEAADRQSDLKSVFKKFLNDDGSVHDYSGYHKAVYAAANADNLAKHFYEQGKADATKDIIAKSKNIQDGKPRTTSNGDVFINGLKVRAITGANGSKLKIKKRT